MSDEKNNESETVVEEIIEGEELLEAEAEAEVIEAEETAVEAEVEELTLEEQLQEARDEAAKNFDNSLRAQAELANARKRFEKQRAQSYVNANVDLVSKLLPVLDDYERAIETVPETVSDDAWYQGIELVYRKLLSVLESLNVKEIEAAGTMFDPHFHDALGQEPCEECESGMVSRVMAKGYQVGDKVVRPALVFVAE